MNACAQDVICSVIKVLVFSWVGCVGVVCCYHYATEPKKETPKYKDESSIICNSRQILSSGCWNCLCVPFIYFSGSLCPFSNMKRRRSALAFSLPACIPAIQVEERDLLTTGFAAYLNAGDTVKILLNRCRWLRGRCSHAQYGGDRGIVDIPIYSVQGFYSVEVWPQQQCNSTIYYLLIAH